MMSYDQGSAPDEPAIVLNPIDLFRGVTEAGRELPAIAVRSWREVVESGVIAAIGGVSKAIGDVDFGTFVWAVPYIYGGLKLLEGIADQIDPRKKRAES